MVRNKFPVLDGVRGVAAILVLILHTGPYWADIEFHHSHLAVDLFFVLSGFVIAHAYEAKLESKTITQNSFVVIRLVRLYPMFFLAALLASGAFLFRYSSNIYDEQGYLTSFIWSSFLTILFLPSAIPGSILLFPLNSPSWSVFYELIINAVYAYLRPCLSKKNLLLIVLTLGLAMGAIAYLHGNVGVGVSLRVTSVLSGLIRSGFGIFLGIYLCRYARKLLSNVVLPDYVIPAMVMLVLVMPDLGILNWLFDLASIYLFFPLAIILGTRCKCGGTTENVFLFLGKVSYPVYLLHTPVASVFYVLFEDAVKTYAPFSGVALVVFLLGCSHYLERYYDIPFRKYLTSTLVNRRTSCLVEDKSGVA